MNSSAYLPRLVDDVLHERLRHHAAVLVVGPRACGKTTTAARVAATVLRLDEPRQAAVVRADPDAALRGLPEPVLIDEWHLVPEVLGAVKRAVDADARPGRFLLTGSVRDDVEAEHWPGTGRVLRLPMRGLTAAEVQRRVPRVTLLDRLQSGTDDAFGLLASSSSLPDLRDYAELALTGGFPEPVLRLPPGEREPWLDNYIDQLLTRDAVELAGERDPERMRRYLEACALNTGGVADRSKLYQAAGISGKTGQAYDRLLRNLLVIQDLPAWWSNRLKRLTRTPKLHFLDPSLALAALRIDITGLMRDGDVLGRVLETFVLAQIQAEAPRCASRPRLFHMRQEKGRHEVDVVVEYGGGQIFALEVKATSAPRDDDARHLAWMRDELGDRFLGGAVLHTGPRAFPLGSGITAAPIATLWSDAS